MRDWVARISRGRDRRTEVTLEVALLLLVFWLTIVVRYTQLEMVEIGGDALRVWEFARRLTTGGSIPAELNHHQARFGLVLPTAFFQAVVGTSAASYFVGPLALGGLLHAATFFVARRMAGVLAGCIAVVVLWSFPEMVRPSSQILPELYGPAYTMTAVAGALVFTDARSVWGRRVSLLVTAGALFLAYGAKLSYLYFAPGCAAFFLWGAVTPRVSPVTARSTSVRARFERLRAWLQRKRLWDAGLLTAVVVACVGLETLLYRIFTKHGSQLAVVEKTHGLSKEVTVKQASDLFAIYEKAGPTWHAFLLWGGAAALVVLVLARDRKPRIFVLLTAVYLLLFTFVLRQWTPPIPWAKPHARYLLAVVPCVAVLVGVAVESVFTWPLRWANAAWRGRATRAIFPVLGAALLALAVSAPALALLRGLPETHAVEKTRRTSETLSTFYLQGIPLVSLSRPPKPLVAAASLYLGVELMRRDGVLLTPNEAIERARPRRGYIYYLVEDTRAPREVIPRMGEEVRRRVAASRCVVVLSQRDRFFSISARKPKSCPRLSELKAEEFDEVDEP